MLTLACRRTTYFRFICGNHAERESILAQVPQHQRDEYLLRFRASSLRLIKHSVIPARFKVGKNSSANTILKLSRLTEQEYQTYFDMAVETAGALPPGLPNGAVRSAFVKLFSDAFD